MDGFTGLVDWLHVHNTDTLPINRYLFISTYHGTTSCSLWLDPAVSISCYFHSLSPSHLPCWYSAVIWHWIIIIPGSSTSGNPVVVIAAATSAVAVFCVLGVVSAVLFYFAFTRCRKTHERTPNSSERIESQTTCTAPVYDYIIPVPDTEKTGIELQKNIAYGLAKK